ncbi:class I SAM-dependent methyltransferase [Paenibacillus tarimensis]|uniref:class I SAM-dependent methyltransferase n=1 Tax=Paenibacillus tarimensis TaxID=416012 RepID=UPI001F33D48A|nr:class I SAM-dependent methyltransferase [Paenibacillus tarimensis]MCF2945750.1 class I SAM-dependent methyltransferase [Paenibacillus tarimensis]
MSKDYIAAINAYKAGAPVDYNEYPALGYLAEAEIKLVNAERFVSFKELENSNPTLDYVERTLRRLNELSCSYWLKDLVAEVLIWSEAAKGGTIARRTEWLKAGFNLFVHNIGSAQIYASHYSPLDAFGTVVRELIHTHGLIGQYLRGEVELSESRSVRKLMDSGLLTEDELADVLNVLNDCILTGVSPELWEVNRAEVKAVIKQLVHGQDDRAGDLMDRYRALRKLSIHNGEPFDQRFSELCEGHEGLQASLQKIEGRTVWFVESALGDFSLEEFLKIISCVLNQPDAAKHMVFEPLMNMLYYEHQGTKKINLYKKRIIEKYLSGMTFEAVNAGTIAPGKHVELKITREDGLPDTCFVTFAFNPVAEKLIDFCVAAENSDVLYERAILMLYDYFGLRRDEFDRFHNEEKYISHMNGSSDFKRVMIDYIVGGTVLDVGPGGGVMLDLVEELYPYEQIWGIDLSENVIDILNKRRVVENRKWNVKKGNALHLEEYFQEGEVDTVLFSSVLHELYSYVPYEGKRFNRETVKAALRSAYSILPRGGRIIIRDGIMTEPEDQVRIIEFLDRAGQEMLDSYCRDFQGRVVSYERVGDRSVKMKVNDAMEFLYTYTWGEESYIHEVQEQFGYFTPAQYAEVIRETLGENCADYRAAPLPAGWLHGGASQQGAVPG